MSDYYREGNLLCGGTKGLSTLHTLNPDYVYLATQHAELMRENIDLNKRVEHLRSMVETRDEIICLYGEALKRPDERTALLTQIWKLMEEVRII